MVNRSQLKFHETFQPESGYIAKILGLASGNYAGSKFEISEITGIPTGNQKGKVEPHIKYAAFMNLIAYQFDKGTYRLSLTDMGEEVFAQDPYLHELLTKWLCHYGITRGKEGAPQWSFFANQANTGFIEPLKQERLIEQANSEFELSATFEEVFGVVKRSYSDGFFSDLGYADLNDASEIEFEELYPRDDMIYVYAYAMMNSWNSIFPNKTEITLLELMEDMAFGRIFGFSDESVNELLDELADEGLVKVNRQLFPATIIRMSDAEELIPQLYSRLL